MRLFALLGLAAVSLPIAVAPDTATAGEIDPNGAAAHPSLVARAIQAVQLPPSGTTQVCPSVPPARVAAPPQPQPVGGYSALVDGPAGSLWAMPDNGYGAKGNSCDFILRVDQIRVDYARRGSASTSHGVDIVGRIQLRDPDRKIPYPIYRQASADRLLTGWDFDPESLRIDRRGDFWFGDEFGPYLLHTDRTGKLLEAPIPTPGVRAPENLGSPPDQPVNLPGSSGFESMAISSDGRYLYPALERALLTEPDLTRRVIFQYDLHRRSYTGKTFVYRADPALQTTPPGQDQHVIAELTAIGKDRYIILERDFRQGTAALFDKIFVIDLRHTDPTGALRKTEVVDLLDIDDRRGISAIGARPGDIGLGRHFSFPYVTTEAVLPVRRDVLAIVNDNNFGSIGGRNPALPDYTDFIEVHVPGLQSTSR